MSCVKNITHDMHDGGSVLHVLREEYHAGYGDGSPVLHVLREEYHAGYEDGSPVLHVLREEYHAGYAGSGVCPACPA